MQWKPGDRVQVRDRRDNALAVLRAVVTRVDGTFVYIKEDVTGFACGVPVICVEPIGQRERNAE